MTKDYKRKFDIPGSYHNIVLMDCLRNKNMLNEYSLMGVYRPLKAICEAYYEHGILPEYIDRNKL